jgi:hypothetical protein
MGKIGGAMNDNQIRTPLLDDELTSGIRFAA